MRKQTQTKAPAAPPLSPARIRLADLQRQRLDALSGVAAETENANRLNVIHDGVEPARSALAACDSERAAAMSRWAKNLINGRPTTNSAQRETLARALADAEQASNAARVAKSEFQANAERARQPLQRMDLEIRKQAKIVALEEAAKLLPAIAEAIATAESLHSRLEAARAEAMSGIEWGATGYGEVNAAVVAFDQARGLAEAKPQPTDLATDWRKFTAALEQSAGIDFEGAQATVIPTLFSPSAPDLATAAMMAVASFPTQSIVR